MPLRDYTTGRSNRILIGTSAAAVAGLIITRLTGLGDAALPGFRIETPDNERAFEISDHGAIGVGTGATPFGANGNCLQSGGGSGELMSWGTCGSGGGGTTNTGGILDAGNSRFVNVSGDTMTGRLVVASSNGIGTTGAVIAEGQITLNDDNVGNAILTFGASTTETMVWSTTHLNFTISDDLGLSGGLSASGTLGVENNAFIKGNLSINSDSTATDVTLLFGSDGADETIVFDNGNDIFEFSDAIQTSSDLYASGALIIEGNASIHGYLSGSIIRAHESIQSSGALVWEGTASGAMITGLGLTDCDADNQTLSWDSTTKKLGCGDDDGAGAAGYSFEEISSWMVNDTGDTMTGALNILVTGGASNSIALETVNTISGTIIHANDTLNSSGGLVWEGSGSGRSLTVGGGRVEMQADGDMYIYSLGVARLNFETGGAAGAKPASIIVMNNATNTYLEFIADDDQSSLQMTDVSGDVTIDFDQDATPTISFDDSTGANFFFIDQASGTRRVAIGNNSPETTLDVIGSVSGASLYIADLFTPGGLVWADGSDLEVTAAGTSGSILMSQGTAAPRFQFQETCKMYELYPSTEPIAVLSGGLIPAEQSQSGTLIDVWCYTPSNTASGWSVNILHADDRSMLSTICSVDERENSSTTAATPPVIDTSNDDIAWRGRFRFEITSVGQQPASGATIELCHRRSW